MKADNFLVFVAVLAVALSAAGTFVTYNSMSKYDNFINGFATNTDTGTVNVTVTSVTAIEIVLPADKIIDFGAGTVDLTSADVDYAYLGTNGTMTGGTGWSTLTQGFVVRNVGNDQPSLAIKSDKAAAAFIGGTSPEFNYMVSEEEAGSCTGTLSGTTPTAFTTGDVNICTVLESDTANDELLVDILLTVPSDSLTGEQSATITLTAS